MSVSLNHDNYTTECIRRCGMFAYTVRSERSDPSLIGRFGFFSSKYDPFVYGCPVENVKDGKYYYDYRGDADLFKKRQYRYTWFGPTRVGISLTYDLLYRRIGKKGASLKRWEKKGGTL